MPVRAWTSVRDRPATLLWTAGVVVLALITGFALRYALNSAEAGSAGGQRPGGAMASAGPTSLAGRTIVLDPGHDGGNGGASAAINRHAALLPG